MSGFPSVAMAHTDVTVTTSSAPLVAADPTRQYLRLEYVSGNGVSIRFGADAIIGGGLVINSNHFLHVMSAALGNLVTAAVNAICSGSAIVRVTEGTGSGGYPFLVCSHAQVQVAVTSTLVLAANVDRKYAMFQPATTEDISIKFGVAAVVDEGIWLDASKYDNFEISAAMGNLFKGNVYAIHGGADTKLLQVVEGT